MKINKNIKIFFNYFLGPLLFLWLCGSIYNQVKGQPGLANAWREIVLSLQSSRIGYLLLVVLLMMANWGTEAYKWMIAIRRIQPIGFIRSFKAILAGVSFSVSTPNNIGEYVGRILYIEEGKRIKAVTLTVVGGVSQLIVSVAMGITGLYFLKKQIVTAGMVSEIWFDTLFYGTIFGFLLLVLFYFRISWLVKWIDKLPSSRKFSWSIEALEQFDATLLLRFLSLSAVRFFIFILQYYCLFRLFGVNVNLLQTWLTISVVFLILAIIPTIALFTDLSIRSGVILALVGLFSTNQLGISLTAIGIWIINLVIPALTGSILVLGIKKIFKNKNETI